MLKTNSMPKPTNNSFQNMEVKFASLSEKIFFGTLCILTTSRMNTYATLLAKNGDLTKMKCATFVNLSTITMMESCCLTVFGNHVMKSMEMNSHFHSGITISYSSPLACLHYAFTRWQSKHLATKYATSLLRFNQH